MNNTISSIKKQTMSRIKTIYWIRRLTSPLLVDVYVCAISLSAIVSLVSVPHVLMNIFSAGTPTSEGEYFFSSVLHTAPLVQAALLAVTIAGLFLLRDIVKNIRHLTTAPSLA